MAKTMDLATSVASNSLEAAARVVVSMVRTDTQEDVKRALQVK